MTLSKIVKETENNVELENGSILSKHSSIFRDFYTKTFSKEEVKEILTSVYEYYEISSTRKFIEKNLSNFQDEPSMSRIMSAEIADIESFIY
mgnify:FL=1